MNDKDCAELRARLEAQKSVLAARLARIKANVCRSLDADSKERAKELEDQEVVDALGNEASAELALIADALQRMDAGRYGVCAACRSPIAAARLDASPYVSHCIDCAKLEESIRARS